jgi:hypothetical protein
MTTFEIYWVSDRGRDNGPPCAAAKQIDGKWFVDLETIDDLLALITECKYELIVDHNPPSIRVYNDYNE